MAAYSYTLFFNLLTCFYLINGHVTVMMYEEMFTPKTRYTFPSLPYGYDGLEPHIDEWTLRVHHRKHHQGYTNKMNDALEKWKQEVI